tara:strand:- start:754 stop:912 length:159 start_codon:yes stop_codon:yes gene_type:complete
MTEFNYDNSDFDIREMFEDTWESFLESSSDDWQPIGIVEELDPETQKLLNEF